MLATLHSELQAAGISLRLVDAHAAVRDILRAEGVEEQVGSLGRHIAMADVLDEFLGGAGSGIAKSPGTGGGALPGTSAAT
jgi:sulfate permease, SulP family